MFAECDVIANGFLCNRRARWQCYPVSCAGQTIFRGQMELRQLSCSRVQHACKHDFLPKTAIIVGR